MYLKSLTIKNFRRITNSQCLLQPGLNLIIGANDSGKTALIDAIRIVLKQVVDDYTRIQSKDFLNLKEDIEINLIFSFDDCGNNDERRIKESSRFAEYLSYTETNDPQLNLWFSIKHEVYGLGFPSLRVGPHKEVAVDMDPHCKEQLKVLYLRPLRDAQNELEAKRGSRISKILDKHESVIAGEDELIDALRTFKTSAEEFFNKTTSGESINSQINTLLEQFDEQHSAQSKRVGIGPTESLDRLRALEKLSLYYEDIQNPGLGTLNMIFIAAELLHLNITSIPKLLLVEEIEAHLHPQRQLKVIKSLQESANKEGIQMILSTHSPNLASACETKALILCNDGNFYSLAASETELEESNYSYLDRFLDVTKSNLFFARGVILVEGITEQLLLPEFARILGFDFTDVGVSVVSINNLGFEHFVNIFKRVNAPYNFVPIAVLTDADKKKLNDIENFKARLEDPNNKVKVFVGSQIYADDQLSKGSKLTSTLEKLVLENTIELKRLYIDALNNTLRDKVGHESDTEEIYRKMYRKKALLAQEVAKNISEYESGSTPFNLLANELRTQLDYILAAITHVIPKG